VPDKLLTLTHIGRIIGEQIYVDARFWTIKEVTTSMHGNHYSIFFRDTTNALMLRREISQAQGGEPYVVLHAVTKNPFQSIITLKEMGDMVTFLDAIAERVNDFSYKWNN
jgi:hypothetical protein